MITITPTPPRGAMPLTRRLSLSRDCQRRGSNQLSKLSRSNLPHHCVLKSFQLPPT